MAETLGSLCDKLTIVKLKRWHSEDADRLKSLAAQEKQLQDEINEFMSAAIAGAIPVERLTFAANKVYKKKATRSGIFRGVLGKSSQRLPTSIAAYGMCRKTFTTLKRFRLKKKTPSSNS